MSRLTIGIVTLAGCLGLVLAETAPEARVSRTPRSPQATPLLVSPRAVSADGIEPLFMPGPGRPVLDGPSGVLVLDGSNVHDVGELWIHVGNWGLFGSWPGSSRPFADAPSGEWPAGSGVEYVFASGLWVGAIKDGVPEVSTTAYEMEFRPTADPVDILYRSSEGAANGLRLPHPGADDDGDGLTDEDWLNGRDDDGDGLTDEDFAAISNQMFSCWYTDNQPEAIQSLPAHDPLDVMVRQESYQWSRDEFDDFVGIDFTITNIGSAVLEDMYIGYFLDAECGPRGLFGRWEDDGTGYLSTPMTCRDYGAYPLRIGYVYDLDGDNGQTPGYFGVLLLDHTTDPTGVKAPTSVGVSTYANFAGSMSYEEGGDPTNDFERYELLSQETIERDLAIPRDVRFVLVVGPFATLAPGESVSFTVALVAGVGRDGLIDHATRAMQAYRGEWFDVDGDALTGIDARETPVTGPAENVVIDACRPELSTPIPFVPEGETVWVNRDCEAENDARLSCGFSAADSALYQTGIGGRERRVPWLLPGSVVPVSVDVKPGSCRNPISLRSFDTPANGHGHNPDKRGGVVPVAIAGTADFDVTMIDAESVRLEGAAARHSRLADVTAPASGACACPDGPDGVTDLVLHFPRAAIAGAFADTPAGETLRLSLVGYLGDGRMIQGIDCVATVGAEPPLPPGPDAELPADPGDIVKGLRASPNPFNPVTRFEYTLRQGARVHLALYDISGRHVVTLVDAEQPAGAHSVVWTPEALASGIYFYRMRAGAFAETRKVILLK